MAEIYVEPDGSRHDYGYWKPVCRSSLRPPVALVRMGRQHTRKTGTATRVCRLGGAVLATTKRGTDGRLVTTLHDIGWHELLQEGLGKSVGTELPPGVKEELQGHRADEAVRVEDNQEVAESRRKALEKYNYDRRHKTNWLQRAAGNVPMVYRCHRCRHYFEIPSPRDKVSCPSCRSGNVKKVK